MPHSFFDPDHEREENAEQAALEHALEVLSRSREGVLLVSDQSVPIRFVTENESGRLIASVPVAAFLEPGLTMFVPQETDDALQLLVTAEEIGEGAETDRWIAHHLPEGEDEPEHVRWGAFWIDSAKHGPWVFDGEAMMRPNPARAIEGRLTKRINADKEMLKAYVKERHGMDVEKPVCVAVDGFGLLVRVRHGVLRIAFDEPLGDEAAIQNAVGEFVGSEE